MDTMNSGVKECVVYRDVKGSLGLSLTRSPCDIYPWVQGVQSGSSAGQAGIEIGDYLIKVNHCDILGQTIANIAAKIQSHWDETKFTKVESGITLTFWNPNRGDLNQFAGRHPMQRYVECLKNITQLLECPVCYETITPPVYQCCNGHVVCNSCRARSPRCAMCRVPIGPRGRCIIAEEITTLLNQILVNQNIVNQASASPLSGESCVQIAKSPSLDLPEKSESPQSAQSDRSHNSAYYRCPIDHDCAPLAAKCDVFTHLQNAHSIHPTHYYGNFGGKIPIDFQHNNLVVILITKKSGFETFFLLRMIHPNPGLVFWNIDNDAPIFDIKLKTNGKQWKGKSFVPPSPVNQANLFDTKNYIKMSVDQAKNNKYEIQIK